MCVCIYTHAYTISSLSIYLISGELGCFQILTVIKNAAVNTRIHIYIYFCCCCSNYCFCFLWINTQFQEWTCCIIRIAFICFPYWSMKTYFILFSIVAAPIYNPTNSAFYTSLPTLTICCTFINSHSDRCEVVSSWGFDLHFSDDQWGWASFHVSVGHL